MYKIIGIVALIAALLGVHYWSQGVAVATAIELTTGRLNKEWQSKLDISLAKKDKAQIDLSNSHYQEVAEKDAKIKDVSGKLTIALRSLQSRPTRSESATIIASGAEVTKTCTGSSLPREDADFLTREAARADQLIVERDYYYNEYSNLQTILEQLRK